MDQQNIINLGARVRQLRNDLGLSIRQLAEQSDVSPGYISQIENGKTNPSVTTLYAIADVMNVSIQAFFDGKDGVQSSRHSASEMADKRINSEQDVQETTGFTSMIANRVTPETRPTIILNGGVTWQRLTEKSDENIEFLQLVYDAGAVSGDKFSRHIGHEFGLVLEGSLQLEIGFETYRLDMGDSILFDSSTPHRLSNISDVTMRALWVAFKLG
jgi:transcriptional regulator with XRE-family HTH domain